MTLQEILSRLGTVAEIAKKLGVSNDTVSAWYSCESYPNVDQIHYIAKITDISAIDLWLAIYEFELSQTEKAEQETVSRIEVNDLS